MDQQKTGRLLRELRGEKGLTQEQLAAKMGVSNRSVSRWENGCTMPDFDLLLWLAEYYSVGIDELLDGERREEKMDKETQQILLKVADCSNEEGLRLTRRLHRIAWAGVFSFLLYLVFDQLQLPGSFLSGFVTDFFLGLALGTLLVTLLFTSRHMVKIRAFKRRLLGWEE